MLIGLQSWDRDYRPVVRFRATDRPCDRCDGLPPTAELYCPQPDEPGRDILHLALCRTCLMEGVRATFGSLEAMDWDELRGRADVTQWREDHGSYQY